MSQNVLNMILKEGQIARDIWVAIENVFCSNEDSKPCNSSTNFETLPCVISLMRFTSRKLKQSLINLKIPYFSDTRDIITLEEQTLLHQ